MSEGKGFSRSCGKVPGWEEGALSTLSLLAPHQAFFRGTNYRSAFAV